MSHARGKIILAILVLVIAAGAGFFSWLRTDAGARFILKQAEARALAKGYELQYGSADLKPFSEFSARNVLIRAKDDSLLLSIEALDIFYKVSLFPLGLTVESFGVDHPKLQFKVFKQVSEPIKYQDLFAQLETLVTDPPLFLALENLRINRLAATISYGTPSLQAQLTFPSISLAAKAALSEDNVHVDGTLDVEKIGKTSIQKGSPSDQMGFAVASEGQLSWDLSVQKRNQKWFYEFQIPKLAVRMTHLLASKSTGSNTREFSAPLTGTTTAIRISAQSDAAFQFRDKVVNHFQWDTQVDIPSSQFVATTGKKKTVKKFLAQSLSLHGNQLKEQIELLLNYGFEDTKTVARVRFDEKLSKAEVEGSGSVGKSPKAPAWTVWFRANSGTPFVTEGSVQVSGGADVLARLKPEMDWKLEVPGSYSNFFDVARIFSSEPPRGIGYEIKARTGNSVPFQVAGLLDYSPEEQSLHAEWEFKTGAYLRDMISPASWQLLGRFQKAEGRGKVQLDRAGDQIKAVFDGNLENGLLKAWGELRGSISKKNILSQGTLQWSVPNGTSEFGAHTVGGSIIFPWTASVGDGRDIMLSGELQFRNASWKMGAYGIEGIHGRVPVSEKFIWDGTQLHFAHLLTQNPFERVDYERLRDLLFKTDQIRIEKILIEDKTLGPLIGAFSVEQNLSAAQQFDITLGQSGRARGEVTFDFLPSRLQLGLLTRLTSINLKEILPERFLKRLRRGDQEISARSGLVVNVSRSTVEGRVDVTHIGGTQLMTLINVVDPTYQNERMNLARTALSYGFPTFVGMEFRNGFLDLSMDISMLGISKRYDVRGIPLTSLITSATADFVKIANEGPLK